MGRRPECACSHRNAGVLKSTQRPARRIRRMFDPGLLAPRHSFDGSHVHDTPHPHLRHDAPRRRAVARSEHEPHGEDGGCPCPGATKADIIEAGFRSPRPGISACEIAKSVDGAAVCGPLGAATPTSTGPGIALQHARQPRIHVFLATSSIHREFKLRMNEDEVLAQAVAGVRRAAKPLRRCRVFARGCADGDRLPLPSRRGRDRRRPPPP